MLEISYNLALVYFRTEVEVCCNLAAVVDMFIFLSLVFVSQIHQSGRFPVTYFPYELFAAVFLPVFFIAERKPLCDSCRIQTRRTEIEIYMIMRTGIVLVVKYVSPLLDSRVLHTHRLNIYLQLVLILNDFTLS